LSYCSDRPVWRLFSQCSSRQCFQFSCLSLFLKRGRWARSPGQVSSHYNLTFKGLPLVSCSVNPQVNARHTGGVLGRTAEQRKRTLAIKQRDSHLSGSELTSNLGFGQKSKITAAHVERSVNPTDSLAARTPARTSS